ncbi:tripartite tricarboxylate transporter substrate binding protein [Falsiroseomonas sp.]|uniref:Bug family tripartite tricarboxylate transporter substrate binding protein n=1 Tax=Falsiroseomonas sp. TaxID=2870721 RepID=UPI0027219AA7|nr:tripartite tricarboxylate transporter substrate binding protein [Falsiroseomonas sp.]MDO9502928.1 tripartite tricarboxylate transporter substrate binding protein [Falsiroseomonas sp.]MDP3418384.1 tripartite tricarboxylate transporter substrate binding protein [Falsiroseomonas sp.]
MLRRTLLSTLAATPLLPGLARAQDAAWPTRPVTIMVPFVAGGPSDIIARTIANRMGQAVGQPVVAENRAGANGEVAARLVMRAPADGHMLFVGSIGVFAINAALRPNLGYDPVRDFAPITMAVTTPNVLVVNAEKVPARTLDEVVAWLKAQDGRASYSTSGVGSSDHLTMELFKQRTGTDVTHVPYQGGAAAATDLIAGNVQISFQNLGTVAAHIQGGRLRAILLTSATRSPVLPDVPTAAEAGLTDFVVTSWQAVMAPAGLPQPVLTKVHAATVAALRHPESVQRLNAIGFDVVANSPDDYRSFQQAEIARWREVVRSANIRAE